MSICTSYQQASCHTAEAACDCLTILPPSSRLTAVTRPETSSKMVQMTGSYTRVSEEGYEDVLKALNVGFMLRKAALASTPTMTITEAGGSWTLVTKTTMKSMELKFK